MLQEIVRLVADRAGFALESTLSGLGRYEKAATTWPRSNVIRRFARGWAFRACLPAIGGLCSRWRSFYANHTGFPESSGLGSVRPFDRMSLVPCDALEKPIAHISEEFWRQHTVHDR